jgi:hypothetical protein
MRSRWNERPLFFLFLLSGAFGRSHATLLSLGQILSSVWHYTDIHQNKLPEITNTICLNDFHIGVQESLIFGAQNYFPSKRDHRQRTANWATQNINIISESRMSHSAWLRRAALFLRNYVNSLFCYSHGSSCRRQQHIQIRKLYRESKGRLRKWKPF